MPIPVILLFVALLLVTMLPLIVSLLRSVVPRGRRETALALHRAQLVELDRDLAEGRIAPADHAAARLEVQRRLLAAADLPEEQGTRSARLPVILTAIAVPLFGFGLYTINGQPNMPSPNAETRAEMATEARQAEQLITMLRTRLATMDPTQLQTAQGYLLLGNAEANRGHYAGAAQAWRMALQAGYVPDLALRAADAQLAADGHLTEQTRAEFERVLAESPANAPWREYVQGRLSGK